MKIEHLHSSITKGSTMLRRIGIAGVLSAIALTALIVYHHINRHEIITDNGITVTVIGSCSCMGSGTCCVASGLAESDSSTPLFIITNTSTQPQNLSIRTMTEGELGSLHSSPHATEPIQATIHLEPGQQFEFQMKTQGKAWKCWIDLVIKPEY